jgi:hypothetical protein
VSWPSPSCQGSSTTRSRPASGARPDPERRGGARVGQHRGGLLVAQHEQVGCADHAAGEPAGTQAAQRGGADADQRERTAREPGRGRDRRRPAQQRQRPPPAGGVQRLEDGPAGDDHGVRALQPPADPAQIAAMDGGDAVLGRGGGGVGGRGQHAVLGKRPAQRHEQRLVAGVALAERAERQHTAGPRAWRGCRGGHGQRDAGIAGSGRGHAVTSA